MDSWLDDIINESYAPKHIEQGSTEWADLRLGRFTSSEIFKIMDCGKRPMTEAELAARPKKGPGSQTKLIPDPSKMSEKGIKYIYKKVWETLTGKPYPEAYAYPLVYGKEQEPLAVEFFEQQTGLKCEQVGFQVWTDHAGGSPDRLIGDTDGLEVKCPSSDEQIEYLMLNDVWDLKRCYPQYYYQCVSLMMFTGRDRWHFCTYDPRMIQDKHKLTHLIIEARQVDEDMEMINKALEGAITEKLKLIQLLA